MSTGSPLRLVLFDVDGTLVDHDAATAAAVEQWLVGNHWANAGTIAGLVSDWDAIAERHFPGILSRPRGGPSPTPSPAWELFDASQPTSGVR